MSRATIPTRDPSALVRASGSGISSGRSSRNSDDGAQSMRAVASATAPAPSPATTTTAAPGTTPAAWDDAFLRSKLIVLVLLAAVGGVGVGIVEAHLKHRIWPLMVGLGFVAMTIAALGYRWLCMPMERFVEGLGRLQVGSREEVTRQLPVDRMDEVGQMARIVDQWCKDVAREQNDAKQLRRTLDDRVEKATTMATRNLKAMAMRDALTDLGNRRFLDEHLPELFESCQESNTDLVCVAIDIDNFKTLNDTLGHGAGDELLRTLGQLLRGLIRHEDYAVRLGGDEFLILMPGCSLSRVKQLIEQLHALFRQHTRVVVRGDVKPDLSLGAASRLRDGIASPQELIKKADDYLYQAKRAGKGRLIGA